VLQWESTYRLGISMVKYASQKNLFFWKVSIKYTLMYWIHEYYLSQSTIISSLTSLHNIEETHVLICIKVHFFEMQIQKVNVIILQNWVTSAWK
jgi:hypothetical protein